MAIRSKGDFDRAHRRGGRARTDDLLVIAFENGHAFESRVGLAIGKRIAKRAVDRNRLRRRIREAFRLEYHQLPRGVDLVVLGAQPGADPSLAEVRAQLLALAPRALQKARAKAAREDAAPAGSGEQRSAQETTSP